VRMVVKLLKWK